MWCATGFSDAELNGYAERQIRADTRRGVQFMALLSIAAQFGVVGLVLHFGSTSAIVSTSILVGLLSIHVLVSASLIDDVRTLHVLGMVFLVVGALAITILAHRTGDLSIGMMAFVVMLFVAITLVPWALREAVIVIGLTYLLLTLSLISVPGRFDPQALRVLQLLVFGSALVVLVVTGRNTLIRKHDIRARYELEIAHRRMRLLSMKDHLTGAWNRRYLDEHFPELLRSCQSQNQALHVAVLDIDDFKGINDQFGHHIGDEILVSLAEIFVKHLGDDGCLVRLGGDEFQVLYCGDDLGNLIDRAITELQSANVAACVAGHRKITLSAGIVSAEPGKNIGLDELYKTADRALYSAKHERLPTARQANNVLMRTGSWQL
jgi:diguanylate cyclase (GGDEF)-like protein